MGGGGAVGDAGQGGGGCLARKSAWVLVICPNVIMVVLP